MSICKGAFVKHGFFLGGSCDSESLCGVDGLFLLPFRFNFVLCLLFCCWHLAKQPFIPERVLMKNGTPDVHSAQWR